MGSSVKSISILFFLSPVLLLGCATNPDEQTPQLVSYLQAKQNYANAIQDNSGGVFNASRRLVPIPPFSEPFAPGTYILKADFRPLSRSCAPKDPHEFALPNPPEIRSKTTFDLTVDSSESFALFLEAEAKASIKRNKTAVLKFVELTAQAASIEDLLVSANNEKCQNIFARFANQEVLVIDSIITGREIISSTKQLSSSAKAGQRGLGYMSISYDDAGGYELSDIVPQPKFWVVAQGRISVETLKKPKGKAKQIIGLDISAQPPSDGAVAHLNLSSNMIAVDQRPLEKLSGH